jgi:FlaA1/EpsC-like NDP-sugar epimerase/lipopolysaccharide/colanic/teichoic acid biosynthesis glycosyltransferase
MTTRLLDVCGAVLGLLVSLPLLLVIAIAVKLDSTGPVLYTQLRIGRGGRPFRLYKFRSMVASARPGSAITGGVDPRVTRVGRLIRPPRLDELPQLLNVLKGDMSLVGPRPEAPSVVDRYTNAQREVLTVRPGITGPTQLVSLDESDRLPAGADPTEHYVRHILPRKLEIDLQYVRSRTFVGDVGILLRTPVSLAQFVLTRLRLGRALKLTRLLADLAGAGVATYLAYLARFDSDIPAQELVIMLSGLPFVLGAYAFAFLYLGTFRSIWRYAGVEDFWQLAKACAIGGGLNAVGMHMMGWPFPRSVLLMSPAFALLLLGGARVSWRTAATAFAGGGPKTERRRIVIVGAGRTGATVAREILSSPGLAYDLVGFVDDDRRLKRATLHNLPVLGTTDELETLTRKHRLNEAIIAIPRPTLAQLRRIREACTGAGLLFKTLPSLGQLVSGDGQVRYLRKVDVGELLQREARSLQTEKIAQFLKGKRVMVTGAGGSIGSELCRQIVQLGAGSLLMVERAENALFSMCAELQTVSSGTRLTAALADIKHILRMSELFAEFQPQVVFHTAAYKHVPMLEAHPTEAVLNNVIGTARLANLAAAHSVEEFIFISTDKAVRPNNLMGATKRICELHLMALEAAKDEELARKGTTKFRIVRFGNVLGSAGSALPLFQRQIENGEPLTITDPDVSRFFMTIPEAVGLVLESTTLDTQGGIAVLDMGEPVKITTLADDLITALGLSPSAVPRQFIGLRPGEKLHEVLWDEVDEVLPSLHPRIAVVRPRGKPLKDMDAFVRQLEQLAVQGLIGPLLAKVQEVIPSYSGHVSADQPRVLQLNPEPRKPLAAAPANGVTARPTGRPPVEQGA